MSEGVKKENKDGKDEKKSEDSPKNDKLKTNDPKNEPNKEVKNEKVEEKTDKKIPDTNPEKKVEIEYEHLCEGDFFKSRSHFIAKSKATVKLLRNEDFSAPLRELINIVTKLQILHDDEKAKPNARIFVISCLPPYCQILLRKKKYLNANLVEDANELFQNAIAVFLKEWKYYTAKAVEDEQRVEVEEEEEKKKMELHKVNKEWKEKQEEFKLWVKERKESREYEIETTEKRIRKVLGTLVDILDLTVEFYKMKDYFCQKKNFYAKEKQLIEKKRSSGQWNKDYEKFVFSIPIKGMSIFYILNVNSFGRYGGMKFLLERLQNIDFDYYMTELEMFEKINYCVCKPLNTQLMKLVVDTVLRKFSKLTEEEMGKYTAGGKNKMFINVIKKINLILKTNQFLNKKMFHRKKIKEVLSLQLNLSLFKSRKIDHKILGLNGINEIIKRIDESEKRALKYLTISKMWISPSYFCEWINKNGIIDSIFEHHDEIIKKGKPIIQFIANSKKINKDLLKIMWELTIKKHESQQTLIFNDIFVSDLIPFLEVKQIDEFFNIILMTKLSRVRIHVVRFLKQFTLIGNKFNKGKNYGMDVVLHLSQDENFISNEITEYSASCMLDMVKIQQLMIKRKDFINFLVKNVLRKASIPQTFQILEEYMTHTRKKLKTFQVEKILKGAFEYVEFIFKGDLKKKVNKKFAKVDMNLSMNNLKEKKNVSFLYLERYKKIDLVNNALRFITLLLEKNAPMKVPTHYPEALWNILGGDKLVKDERNSVIEWFMNSKNYFVDIVQFFEKDVMNINTEKIDLNMFLLFSNFFVKVNTLEKRIRREEKSRKLVIFDSKLKGIEKLWQIAVTCVNENVSKYAINYLNDFRNDFAKRVTNLKEIREDHIKQCLVLIDANKKFEKRIINCIKILQDFMMLYLRKDDIVVHGENVQKGSPMEVFVKEMLSTPQGIKEEPNAEIKFAEKFKIHGFSKMGYVEFSKIIGLKFKFPPEMLKIYYGDVELNKETKDLGFLHKRTVLVKRMNIKEICYDFITVNLTSIGLTPLGDAFKKSAYDKIIEYAQKEKKLDDERLEKEMKKVEKEKQEKEKGTGKKDTTETADDKKVKDTKKDEKKKKTKTPKSGTKIKDEKLKTEKVTTNEAQTKPPQKKKPKDDPVSLLSKHFIKLFSLLDLGDNIAKYVFTLLLHLPTNEEILNGIQKLEKLEEFYPAKSKYKLLYSLQITINEFLSNEEWKKMFIKKGGFKHLMDIVKKTSIEEFAKTKLFMDCFSCLLKLINYFLKDGQQKSTSVDEIKYIIRKIYKIILTFKEEFEEKEVDVLADFRNRVYLNKVTVNVEMKKKKKRKANFNNIQLKSFIHESLLFFLNSFEVDKKGFLGEIFICEDFRKFIVKYVINNQKRDVVKETADGLKKFAKYSLIRNEIIQIYFDHIKTKCTREAYDFFIFLLKKSDVIGDLEKKIILVSEIIIRCGVREKTMYYAQDSYMFGMINVLAVLIRRSSPEIKLAFGESELAKEMYNWAIPKKETYGLTKGFAVLPKCKSPDCRRALFKIFVELSDGCEKNAVHFLGKFGKFMGDIIDKEMEARKKSTSISRLYRKNPRAYLRSREIKFVGLRNFGAICYLNSLTQQLFMTIPFRNHLLQTKMKSIENDNEVFVHALRRVFAFLSNSVKKFHVHRKFCLAYKDFDGRPVNVGVQKDVDEFLFRLMDQVEEGLKNSDDPKLLNRCYKGEVTNEILYEGKVVSVKSEKFYKIIVPVKNKNTLESALQLVIEGEHLTGNNQYYLEKLKKRVDAVRKTVFRVLPPMLIFHLKRFEYNYDLRRNEKYHGRLEFPHDLDMKPYCAPPSKDKAMFEDGYYKYKLVGVLVHRGGADSGHYYSYIMDRSNERQEWYEFNDSSVTKYDVVDLESDSFGGAVELVQNNKKKKLQKRHSAYMLFYQRCSSLRATSFALPKNEKNLKKEERETKVSPNLNDVGVDENGISVDKILEDDEEEEEGEDERNEELKFLKLPKGKIGLKKLDKYLQELFDIEKKVQKENKVVKQYIPDDIYEEVWGDNLKYFLDLSLYSREFDSFFFKLVKRTNSLKLTLKPSVRYLVDVLAESVHFQEIDKWVQYFSLVKLESIQKHLEFLEVLVETPDFLHNILLRCKIASLKEIFSKMILNSFIAISADVPEGIEMSPILSEENNVVLRVIISLNDLLRKGIFHRNFSYELVKLVFSICNLECVYFARNFVTKGVIGNLCHLISIPKSISSQKGIDASRLNISKIFSKRVVMVSIKALSFFSRCCQSRGESPHYVKHCIGKKILMPEVDSERLFNNMFFVSILRCGLCVKEVEKLLIHWCWENLSFSKNLGKLIIGHIRKKEKPKKTVEERLMSGIGKDDDEEEEEDTDEHLFHALTEIFKVEDSREMKRVSKIGEIYFENMLENKIEYKPTLRKVKYIAKLGSKYYPIRDFLVLVKEDLQSVCKFHNWTLKFNIKGLDKEEEEDEKKTVQKMNEEKKEKEKDEKGGVKEDSKEKEKQKEKEKPKEKPENKEKENDKKEKEKGGVKEDK